MKTTDRIVLVGLLLLVALAFYFRNRPWRHITTDHFATPAVQRLGVNPCTGQPVRGMDRCE